MKKKAIKKWILKNKYLLIACLAGLISFILFTILFNIIIGLLLLILIIGGFILEDKFSISNKIKKKLSKKKKNKTKSSNNKVTIKSKSKKSIALSKNSKAIVVKKESKKVDKDNMVKKSKKEKDPVKRRKRKKIRRFILMSFIVMFFIFFLIALALACGFCYYIVTNAPDFNPEALYSTEPTIIYDKYGNEIDRIGVQQRIILEYEELPEVLINAIIATEDSQFFQHNGVDIKRFLMASAQQLSGTDAGGASTLTMQLSKKNYTSDNASGIEGIIRKFTDVYISVFKIEPTYTKQEILTFYINSNYLGGGYGVEQTSLTYFGKSAKDLNLAEAAMIAGLFQAPGKYNPYTNPEGTETRRQNVLKLMLRHGYIDQTEYDIAKEMTVDKIVKENSKVDEISEYQSFIDQVTAEVYQKTGKDPAEESMKIYTTMDPDKQRYVTAIMNGETYEWENDIVKAGVAVVDVHTGEIVALGGGRNINSRKSLNYATQIRRQIGSTSKPLFDYAPAIEFNGWGSAQPITDEPITYSNGVMINNWDGGYSGYQTMLEALMYSRNIPALKTFQSVDKSKLIPFLQSLGLHPEVENGSLHEAHAIGGYAGESALTMAAAFAAFANNGYYTAPYSFYKVEFADGTVYNNVPVKTKAMSEQTAFIMAHMLTDTAKVALNPYQDINGQIYGAKTGTTNYDYNKLVEYGLEWSGAINDLWVVGFNTDYAIGVWYGYDEFDGINFNRLGSIQHSRLFNAVASGFFNNNQDFQMPAGVSVVKIEYGCAVPSLASDYTPNDLIRYELYVTGTEPTNVSERFDKLKDLSNLKASANGSTVTLTWTAAPTPMAKNQEALREYYKQAFRTEDGLNRHLNEINSYNNNLFGDFGYNVYVKDKNGNTTFVGFTKDTTYVLKNQTGSKTYIVRAAYEKFPNNMSDGKSVSIQLNEAYVDVNKNNFIKQLYTYCLNKTATTDDLERWSTYQSASVIAYSICSSSEASSIYDDKDDDLTAIFNGILGRTYTTGEYNSVKEMYDESRSNTIKEIINSQAFKTYCTNKKLVYTEI